MPVWPKPAHGPIHTLRRLRWRLYALSLRETGVAQGIHIDPQASDVAPPSSAGWSRVQWRAAQSNAMARFADGLRPLGGGDVRDGVIQDLATYYKMPADQVVHHCLHWEEESVAEWKAAASSLADFYNSVTSWSFDLLWFSYLQAAGYTYPQHVVIADQLPLTPGSRVLDFGSGVGVSSQLFAALGHHVELADISEPLLSFARWRLERRGVTARYNLLPAELPSRTYDLITAVDTFAHVPDADETARQLYAAVRLGGYVVTNFDVRPKSDANSWHLYEDDLQLRWALERNGFVQTRLIDGNLRVYQARPMSGARWLLHRTWAWCHLASAPRRGLRASRRSALRLLVQGIRLARRR